MHSYHVLYETGRVALRSHARRDEKVEFRIGERVVKRPLKVVTYHARDVYPELLRSTLLVRVVAAYEAFLVDIVREISHRSIEPFLHDGRVEFSQEQLLTIDANEGVYSYLVHQTLRRLTNGGLKEIRKFYQNRLGIDLTVSEKDFETIAEIHDRRHIYVHRSGYVDDEYLRKYPDSSVVKGGLILVPENYLNNSISALDTSALHIKTTLETRFPSTPVPRYLKGGLILPGEPKHLQYVSIRPVSEKGRVGLDDLSLDIGNGRTLRDIAVWASDDGDIVRLLVGGADQDMKGFRMRLRNAHKDGYIRFVDSFKIKR